MANFSSQIKLMLVVSDIIRIGNILQRKKNKEWEVLSVNPFLKIFSDRFQELSIPQMFYHRCLSLTGRHESQILGLEVDRHLTVLHRQFNIAVKPHFSFPQGFIWNLCLLL